MISEDIDSREGLKPFIVILGFKQINESILDEHSIETYILETQNFYYEILFFVSKKNKKEDVSINVFTNPHYKPKGATYHYPEVIKFMNENFHSLFRKYKINKLLNNG